MCLPQIPEKDYSKQHFGNFKYPALTIGWGLTEEGYTANILKKLPRSILLPWTCKQLLRTFAKAKDRLDMSSFFDKTVMVCSSDSGGRDQCQGDSGAPWVVLDRTFAKPYDDQSRWTLMALTSWGPGGSADCGQSTGIGAKLNGNVIQWIGECTGLGISQESHQ